MGYVIHEISEDLAPCLSLSMTSLDACTDHAGVIVFCRPEIAPMLPQIGVSVCTVPTRVNKSLEHGAASHQIVIDHGCDILFLLEPTTVVLKDVIRDAIEMRALKVSGVPYEEVGESPPVINSLAINNPDQKDTYSVFGRDTLPTIITPCNEFGRKIGIQRWICGYTYKFGEGGWNAVKGSTPGLCIAKSLRDMVMAVGSFQKCSPNPTRVSHGPGLTRAPALKYYAVLLKSRPERVAIVEEMREGLPEDSLTVVDAVEGRSLNAAELSALSLARFLDPPYYDAYVPDRPILVNTVASFMSHVRAIKRLIEDLEKDPEAVGVILEDDVRFLGRPGEFHEKVVDTCRALWSDGVSESDHADVVQMFVMPIQRTFVSPIVKYGRRNLGVPQSEHVVLPSPESNWGMQCYMMRLKGAKKLLEGFSVMRGAADEQISRIPGLDLRCLVGPPIIEEDTTNAPSVTQAGSSPLFVKDVVYGL